MRSESNAESALHNGKRELIRRVTEALDQIPRPSQPRAGPSNADGNGISTYNRNKRNKNYGGNACKQRRE